MSLIDFLNVAKLGRLPQLTTLYVRFVGVCVWRLSQSLGGGCCSRPRRNGGDRSLILANSHFVWWQLWGNRLTSVPAAIGELTLLEELLVRK